MKYLVIGVSIDPYWSVYTYSSLLTARKIFNSSQLRRVIRSIYPFISRQVHSSTRWRCRKRQLSSRLKTCFDYLYVSGDVIRRRFHTDPLCPYRRPRCKFETGPAVARKKGIPLARYKPPSTKLTSSVVTSYIHLTKELCGPYHIKLGSWYGIVQLRHDNFHQLPRSAATSLFQDKTYHVLQLQFPPAAHPLRS